jgi:DNA-directed RNA polymerase specialized sigma24 family protein
VAGTEEWRAVVALLRAAPDPLQSEHVARLYELALSDGPRLLRSFRRRLGDERIVDLVHDLLAVKLEAIIAAEEPRALFCTALHRRAISWLRRGDAIVMPDGPEVASAPTAAEEETRGFVHDALAALRALPAREREIVVAAAVGEDREAIAREFGTSRANVDQIVSRARRRLSEDTE